MRDDTTKPTLRGSISDLAPWLTQHTPTQEPRRGWPAQDTHSGDHTEIPEPPRG